MSTLLVDELFNGVVFSQNIRVSQSVTVAWIRPWIYKQGTIADGSLRLRVYDGVTLLKTVQISAADINSAITQQYAHGYVRFDVGPLALNVGSNEPNHVYTLEFEMVNHTTNVNNFIGIVREWDIRKYPIYGAEPTSDSTEPCGLEFYTYRRV